MITSTLATALKNSAGLSGKSTVGAQWGSSAPKSSNTGSSGMFGELMKILPLTPAAIEII